MDTGMQVLSEHIKSCITVGVSHSRTLLCVILFIGRMITCWMAQQIAIITGSVQQCDCPGEDRVGECGSSILNYLLAYII